MKEIQQLRSIVDALEADSKDVGQFKDVYKKLESSLSKLEAAKADIEEATKTTGKFVSQSQDRFIDILKSLNELKDTTIALQNLKGVISSEVAELQQSLTVSITDQAKHLEGLIKAHFAQIEDHAQKAHNQLTKLFYVSITVSTLCLSVVGFVLYHLIK